MYAISYCLGLRHIRARELVPHGVAQPPLTYPCNGNPYVETNHAKALIAPMLSESDPQCHIVRSVAPWDVISLTIYEGKHDNMRSLGSAAIIGNQVFNPVRTSLANDIVSIWDVTTRDKIIPLCKRRNSGAGLILHSADWHGQTWMSADAGHDSQVEESRELCTIVRMSVDTDSVHAPQIATGDGGRLYGNVYYGDSQHGSTIITALDPRESNVAEDIYSDGLLYPPRYFRDIPNGIATITWGIDQDETYCVTIFDCRASAMIGTDMVISRNERLFCLAQFINEIGARIILLSTCMRYHTARNPVT